jgi:hypothetical protein
MGCFGARAFVSFDGVVLDIQRRGRCVVEGPAFPIIANIVQAIEFSMAGRVSLMVDDIVAEAGDGGSLKTNVAAEVVSDKIMAPGGATPWGE